MFIEQDERTLELIISPDFKADMRRNLSDWARFISRSLLQVYGRWPREQWRMTVAPASATGEDPIPWAQVHRDDINTIEFFVSPLASTTSLNQAWTGYHELAHLLIPYRGWGDAWFSEGLATYYQNILQARAGILTEQEMWQNVYEGLLRGQADSGFNDKPLREVSDALRTEGGFMRVYWSGAWYFLQADVRLRQQSGGKLSLDNALSKLNLCCANRTMSVPQIVAQLDLSNEVILFGYLYQAAVESRQIPPFERLFASLGITARNGVLTLQQHGPGARLRREIVDKVVL